MATENFKDSLQEYIAKEKEYIEADIEAHKQMSDDEKVEDGFLLKDAMVVSEWGTNCYDLEPDVNNTRFRPGDRAIITGHNRHTEVRIIDNGLKIVSIHCDSKLKLGEKYDLEVCEAYLLDPLQTTLENCVAGAPGFTFLSQLAKVEEVTSEGMFPLDKSAVAAATTQLNDDQRDCCEKVAMNPSILCMQGPPGTGKTKTLATAANMVSTQGEQVLIIALTHQAVNNALNQIRKINPHAPIIKIGDAAKVQQLDATIDVFPSMKAYKDNLRANGRRGKAPRGLIIGMTYHAALINFGLQHQNTVNPTYLFLDEASQMPLTYASALGTFGVGSICLFGDSRQMPPIFRPELQDSPLSVSILDHASLLQNVPMSVLHTTYRMNEDITQLISRRFYETHGITLNTENKTSAPNSIVWKDSLLLPNADIYARECNNAESVAISEEIKRLISEGIGIDDIAVITPWRYQVNNLREHISATLQTINRYSGHLPLIDTVERLQGQDVEVIIMSFATTDERYLYEMQSFLLNPNRLNVMISRAKSRVIVFSHKRIWNEIMNISASANTVDVQLGDLQPEPQREMFYIEDEPDIVREARGKVLDSFSDLLFYEEPHIYLLNGKVLNSVSTIGHRFESRPFDVEKSAVAYAQKNGYTPEYWKTQWECNSFRATTLGTKTHEFGESLSYLKVGHPEFMRPSVKSQYLKTHNYLAPIHAKEQAVESFLNELPKSYHLVLNETKVYSGKNPDATKNLKEQLCGTFDMLYYYDGDGDISKAGFVIFDYKTNANLYNEYNRQNHIMLKSPLEDLFQESLGEYTVQLSLYALMLEDIGLPIIDRKLVWLKDDGTYEIKDTLNISDILRKTL